MQVIRLRVDEVISADIDDLVRESESIGVPVNKSEIARRALRLGLAALRKKRAVRVRRERPDE